MGVVWVIHKRKEYSLQYRKKCLHNEAIKSRNRGRKRRHRSLPFYTYTIEVGLLKVEVEKWTTSLTKVIKKRLHQYVGNYRFKIFFSFLSLTIKNTNKHNTREDKKSRRKSGRKIMEVRFRWTRPVIDFRKYVFFKCLKELCYSNGTASLNSVLILWINISFLRK